MSTIPKKLLTAEEYLALERQAEFNSESYRGEVFAMAGAPDDINDSLELKSVGCAIAVAELYVRVNVDDRG